MEEEIKDQRIQDYLADALEGEELKDFENQMQQDPELAAEVAGYQNLERGLHGIGVEHLATEISAWEADYQQAQTTETKAVPFRPYYAVAAAITLLIVTGIFLFWNPTPDMAELYAQHYTPYEDMILDRSDATEGTQELLVQGMEAYNNQQYAQAEERLQEYLTQAPDQYGAALYLGIAQLETDRFEAAEASFTTALQDANFEQQAQWYLSLLYLKSDQPEETLTALQTIANSPQHYKNREATALLEEIE
ncbi:MAG: hypothetical protein ACFB15_11705 [Cyclobacteriaceae bacterium]